MQDSFNLGARMLPREAHCGVARAAMVFLGDAIMDLLAEEAIPAFNMCAQHGPPCARMHSLAHPSFPVFEAWLAGGLPAAAWVAR